MFTLFTESTENSTPVAGQFILGLEADGAEFRYPLGAALATLFSDSSSTSVAVPRLKQLTSTTSDPTVSDYGAGEWGVHKNSSTGDLFLAYNDGGAMSNLSLSGGDDWGSQVVETDATLAGNGTAGSPLSVVASGGGLTNWEESGTTLQPTTAGYAFGAVGNEVGDIVSSGNLDLTGDIILGGDAYLKRIDADHIGMYNGVTPQSLSLYNTYTGASNYERGGMRWDANALKIGTEAAGTGTQRAININGIGISTSLNITNVRSITTGGSMMFGPSDITGNPVSPSNLGTLSNPFRDIFLSPSSSLTPQDNGDLCIEATNDTTLTFKYKGSDSVVRTGTIALS